MHVARLQISGVRGFYGERAVDLDLTRPDGSLAGWTVLAGRNASGKSTFLQSLALALSGPRSTGFVPNLADWMSRDFAQAEIRATLHVSEEDYSQQPTLFTHMGPTHQVWMSFIRPEGALQFDDYATEPEIQGEGLDSLSGSRSIDAVRSGTSGWFYTGYGPFRHLGSSTTRRSSPSSQSRLAKQVSSLFDETVPLADAIDWLVDQHLLRLENRQGADQLLNVVTTLLSDGLLPDGFEVRRVDSDGLWVKNQNAEFPLREMSDGYRAITALVVDIVRQLSTSYKQLSMHEENGILTLPYPGVILIDEVDAHLHVSWQQKIGTWLKSHFPKIQFIVSTHSPYICQSADPGGLISLPGPREHRPPRIVGQDLYQRVVFGSGDDAILSELFGVDTPYSPAAERMRERLGDLEIKVLDGRASVEEKEEYRALSDTLTSSLSARADEVASRLRHER